ncbi:MAG: GNAT family protein, partial [Rubrivivax sp.]
PRPALPAAPPGDPGSPAEPDLPGTGLPVGMLSLLDIDTTQGHAQSGRFLIGDEAAVRGLPVAAEAMKLLYALAFDHLGLRRVHGHIAAGNPLMIKWQKYLGMQEEGRLRQHVFIDGSFQDLVLLGLMEHEYRKTALPRLNALIAAARPRRAAAPVSDTVSA